MLIFLYANRLRMKWDFSSKFQFHFISSLFNWFKFIIIWICEPIQMAGYRRYIVIITLSLIWGIASENWRFCVNFNANKSYSGCMIENCSVELELNGQNSFSQQTSTAILSWQSTETCSISMEFLKLILSSTVLNQIKLF